MKTNKLPNIALVAFPTDLPYNIKKPVPNSPKTIPTIFRALIGSFIMKADSSNTIMGVVTMITAAEIGEVKLNPLKNVSIFKATPKKAAATIRGKSFRCICCFGPIKETSQNNTVAPNTLNNMKPNGLT
jgi:hypothetical protein